jgi:plasmid stabilization system protein ParE
LNISQKLSGKQKPQAGWYAERSATAAVAFSEEMDAAESAIVSLPDAWPRHEHGTRRYLLRRFPFSIVYRIEERRVLIVAVAHAGRRPGHWQSRPSTRLTDG